MATKQQATELEFLRYFYETVRDSIGPADAVYYYVRELFIVESGKELPQGYVITSEETNKVFGNTIKG